MTILVKNTHAVLYCDSGHTLYGSLIRKQRFLKFLNVVTSMPNCTAYVSLTENYENEHSVELHEYMRSYNDLELRLTSSRNTFCELRFVRELLEIYDHVHIVSSWYHKSRINSLLYMYLTDENRKRVTIHKASTGYDPLLAIGAVLAETVSFYKSLHYTIQRDYYENESMDIPPEIIPNNKFRKLLDKLHTRGIIAHVTEPKQYRDKSKKAP